MQHRQQGTEAGFSLVELLIVLALLAVIASLLVGAIASARQALQAVDRQGVRAAVPAVQAVLRRLITEARPGPDTSERIDADRAFVGGPDRMSFVSSFVPQGQHGGLWRYEIGLDAGGEAAGVLVLAQRIVRPVPQSAGGSPPRETRTVLIKEVRGLRLRYFGAAKKDGTPRWHDSWQHPFRLPHLVSVDIDLAQKEQRQWTPLVAGPSLTP